MRAVAGCPIVRRPSSGCALNGRPTCASWHSLILPWEFSRGLRLRCPGASMATDEQVDDMCRRLQGSRREIFEVVQRLKGDAPRTTDPNTFPRSHIMRALTGKQGRSVLRNAAVALAMSRPKTAWRLA